MAQMKPSVAVFNSNDIYPIEEHDAIWAEPRYFLLKRRGSGRKHFIIISGRPYEQKNIISQKKQMTI
jgi:hypothetical protein